MAMTLEEFKAGYDKNITERIVERGMVVPRAYERYMAMKVRKEKEIKGIIWSAFSPMSQWKDAERIPLDTPVQRYQHTAIMTHFGQAFEVTRLHMEYGEDLGEIAQWGASLGDSCSTTISASGAAVLSGGFASVQSPDGVFLFSASHPTAGSTQSNLVGAAALSPATVSAMRLAMENRVDFRGKRTPEYLRLLVVPTALRDVAQEITGSELKPYTTDNQINASFGLDFVVDPFLTSATAFFGFDPNRNRLRGWIGQPPTQHNYDVVETKSRVYGLYADFVFDAFDWAGTAGCAGA